MRGSADSGEAKYNILAIDDERDVAVALQRLLVRFGFKTTITADPSEVLALLELGHTQAFDLLVADVNMPAMDGLELLQRVKQAAPDLPVVMLTGDASAETAVRALQSGAFNYLTKSQLGEPEKVALVLSRAAAFGQLRRHARALEERVTLTDRFERLIGASEPMRNAFATIDRVAGLDVSILVLGESGTGKELVARAIHDRSHRADGPFVALNCAALPDALVDSELFGHTRGAFTGAVRTREGAFARANGGTLFLDEIGDISPAVQIRLLRVLQESEVIPVGGDAPVKVDVRVIAATLVDLEEAVASGDMRPDLYYRLNVVTVDLPPLRNRIDDLPLLTAHLLHKHAERMGRSVPSLTPAAAVALGNYRWPGNVRELENALQRALALTAGDVIDIDGLPESIASAPRPMPPPSTSSDIAWADELPLTEARRQVLEGFERNYLVRLLENTGGNISAAARRAGVDRSNLRRIMNRHGIKAQDYS